MSGRFFRSLSDSDSDTSSDEESLMSDSDEETTKQSKQKKPRGSDDDSDESDDDDDDEEDSDDDDAPRPEARKVSRFMRGAASDDDSDEDEVRKVIKSAKDKRADEIEAVVKSIENAQQINDWVAISKEYDSLIRLSERQTKMSEAIPPSFIRIIAELESFLAESIAKEKSATKKMKAPNAKAMNGMKQRIKKTLKEYEEPVAQFREDPDGYEERIIAANAAAQSASAEPKGPTRTSGAAGGDAAGEPADDDFQTVGRGGRALNLTSEGLFKSLAGILEARGKKSTDRTEQVTILAKLLEVAVSPYQKIRVLLALVAARFDYNPTNTHMAAAAWNDARSEINILLETLAGDRGYVIQEETADYDDSIDRIPNENGEGSVVAVRGSVISFIDRLDDEFTKALQNIDPHSTEYIERLSDEKLLYQTMIRAQVYFEDSHPKELDRVVLRRLEHIYSKQDIIIQALEAANATAQPNIVSRLTPSAAQIAEPKGPTALVRSLCVHLYKALGLEAERARTRAILCHIYHHALHADYHTARDMFLMSRLQESIDMADAATQILFNRVVVQLGMSAFRVGLVKEAQSALHEIFATGRVKELLAQGIQRQNQYSNISPEQEKLDRQRQLPFHMHINLELLECVYLVSSMLLEVPNIAYAGNDPELRKKVISRPFRRMLDYTDRQVFSGPPENTRDHIMQATKALQNGDWKGCIELVENIKIWNLMPGWETVSPILAKRIQEEGLRTYLFTYASYYSTVSLSHLAETFELPIRQVRTIVSRMIWSEELAASFDPVTSGGVVVLHRLELSKVQQLAQTLAEKANSMLEQNERSLDTIIGDGKDRSGPSGGDRNEREGGGGGRREGRRGGGSNRGRGRGRGRAQFQALGAISQRV